MGPLLLQGQVDQGIMAKKEYSAFPKALALKPYNQMLFRIISRSLFEFGYKKVPCSFG